MVACGMAPGARLRFEIPAACAAVVVALWAGIGILAYQARYVSLEASDAVLRNVARSLAEYQTSSVRAIDVALQNLRDEWQRDPSAFDRAVARQEEHLRGEKVIQVAVVDRDGWVLYSRLPYSNRDNFADRQYFQVQKSGGVDVLLASEPVMGRVTRQLAIQFSRPLLDAAGRFNGIIVMAVPPPALESVFNEIDLGQDGFVALAREDGTVLARTGGAADDVERRVSSRRLANYPLVVSVGQGMRTALAAYYRQRNLLLTAGAAATVLLIALALLLMGRMRERASFLEARERLMLDLHDGCIQSIYAIGLGLENCRRLVRVDAEQASRAIAEAGANLNLVIQDLRSFISGARRARYSEAQFMSEIDRMIPQNGAGFPRFSVEVDPSVVARLKGQQAEHVLRITREAVSNVVRHAGARHARIVLAARGGNVQLEVTDDGGGIAGRPEKPLGLGLHHIQARARRLRGTASITSGEAGGTRVAVEFPERARA